MGPDAMILVFWMLSFKPTFSLSCFTFIKRLFRSSSLSAIRVVSSAYLRLLIFLPYPSHTLPLSETSFVWKSPVAPYCPQDRSKLLCWAFKVLYNLFSLIFHHHIPCWPSHSFLLHCETLLSQQQEYSCCSSLPVNPLLFPCHPLWTPSLWWHPCAVSQSSELFCLNRIHYRVHWQFIILQMTPSI